MSTSEEQPKKEEIPKEEAPKKKKVIYYEDDYSETITTLETDDMPSITVTYKPLNMLQTSQLTDQVVAGRTVEGAALATLEMITRHVMKWDVAKPSGMVINHKDIKELQRLDPGVINIIARLIRKDKSSPAADVKAIQDELKNL